MAEHTIAYPDSEPNRARLRPTVVRLRQAVGWVFAAFALISCSDTDPTDRSRADVQRRVADLEGFTPDPSRSGEQCGDLSVSNGFVQLNAGDSRLARAVQTHTPVPRGDLRLIVQFGTGFPSFTCTDLEFENRIAVVDETWPASAASATFTVVLGDGCSVATLDLVGVEVEAPTGQQVPLGDIAITNPAWQWWHPSECHLDDPPPG